MSVKRSWRGKSCLFVDIAQIAHVSVRRLAADVKVYPSKSSARAARIPEVLLRAAPNFSRKCSHLPSALRLICFISLTRISLFREQYRIERIRIITITYYLVRIDCLFGDGFCDPWGGKDNSLPNKLIARWVVFKLYRVFLRFSFSLRVRLSGSNLIYRCAGRAPILSCAAAAGIFPPDYKSQRSKANVV